MKIKFNQAALRKIEQDAAKKMDAASRTVQAKSAGKSPSEVAEIARSEFKRIGVTLNEEGVQKFVDAASGD